MSDPVAKLLTLAGVTDVPLERSEDGNTLSNVREGATSKARYMLAPEVAE